MQKECHAVKVRLNQLRDKIAVASEVAGITLDEGAHEDITVCMLYYMCSGKININFLLQAIASDGFKFLEDQPKDSFKYIFW